MPALLINSRISARRARASALRPTAGGKHENMQLGAPRAHTFPKLRDQAIAQENLATSLPSAWMQLPGLLAESHLPREETLPQLAPSMNAIGAQMLAWSFPLGRLNAETSGIPSHGAAT